MLFADLIGFTPLCEKIGIEPAYVLVTEALRRLDETLRRHGGAVDKYLGDALMAVFGYPAFIEQPAASAVRAALEMRGEVERVARGAGVAGVLGLRVGINTGAMLAGDLRGAVIREFHLLGDAVNTAARIKSKAPVGHVFVGSETCLEAGEEFDFEALTPMAMKGKAQPVPVFDVRSAELRAARVRRAAALVGRDAERKTLDGWAQGLADGHGGLAWITGATGLGKSALAAELVAHPALAKLPRLVMEASEGAAGLCEAAQAGGVPVAAQEGKDPEPEDVGRALALAAPALLLVDDVDRAGPDALRALTACLSSLGGAPVLAVLSGGPEAPAALASLLPSQDETRPARQIVLAPLSPRDAAALLDTLEAEDLDPELRAHALSRAAGNPARLQLALHLEAALRSEQERLAQHAERRSETERRRTTVLFADITGFTAMSERMDPQEAYPLVAGCLALLDEIACKHGGTVDKYLGDCVLALFGVPRAIEDAPRAAVNAAIEMVSAVRRFSSERGLATPLDVHVGIHTGLGLSGEISGPLIREFAVMGDPVDVASQLTDEAEAGQVYVGEETRRFTSDAFEYRPIGPVPVKGMMETVPAFELLSRSQRLHRAQVGRERRIFSALVGREAEQHRLHELLEQLRGGRGCIAMILAEAGIGKSRLVAELAQQPEAAGTEWLLARALSNGQRLGFHPFADLLHGWAGGTEEEDPEALREKLDALLARVLGDEVDEFGTVLAALAGAPLRPEEQQRLERMGGDVRERLVHSGFRELLRRASALGPVVLVLEDLHWADVSSIELLESLLPLAAAHPILFLGVARPGYASTSGRVSAFAAELPGELLEELTLERLRPESARRMLKNLFRDGDIPIETRRSIEAKTGGNPFYIEEVVRGLVEVGAVEFQGGRFVATESIAQVEIPGTVQEVVMSRIDRLPIGHKRVLEIAAVVGGSFAGPVVAAALGSAQPVSEVLQALEAAEFLVRSGRLEFGFKHPLIQELAYAGLVAARRKVLHQKVGEAIEACTPEGEAGRDAMLAYHYSLAEDAEKAEEHLFRAGDEAAQAAASSDALHFFREASHLYLTIHRDGGDPSKRARLEKSMARALFNKGQLLESVEHFDEALRFLGWRAPRSELAANLRLGGNLLVVALSLYLARLRGRRPAATERQRETIEVMFLRALSQTTAAPMRLFVDTMATLRRLSRVDPASIPDAGGMYAGAIAIFSYGGVSFSVGRRLLDEAQRVVAAGGTRDLYLYYRIMNWLHHFLAGDWSPTHRLAAEEIDEGLAAGRLWDVTTYLNLEGVQRLYQGDFAGANERIDALARIADLYQHDLATAALRAMRAYVYVEQRALEPALEAIEVYYDEHPEPLWQLSALGTRAKLELLRGQPQQAEEALERAQKILAAAGRVIPYQSSSYFVARYMADVSALERSGGASSGGSASGNAAHVSARRGLLASRRAAARVSEKVALRRPEVLRLQGRELWLRGHASAALARWERALGEAERLGTRPERARLLAEVAWRLRAEGSPSELELGGRGARALAEEAQREHRSLGLQEAFGERPGAGLQDAAAGDAHP